MIAFAFLMVRPELLLPLSLSLSPLLEESPSGPGFLRLVVLTASADVFRSRSSLVWSPREILLLQKMYISCDLRATWNIRLTRRGF